MKKNLTHLLVACLILVLPMGVGLARADDKADAEAKVKKASEVLKTIMSQEDKAVPHDLLKKAKAVAIFPGMVKAGFVIGGQGGSGVVLAKKSDGSYSPPAFFSLGGASVGLQLGAQSTDLLMVIMTQKGLNSFLSNQGKLGVDAGVAAGPVGRRAEAGVTGVGADIYSYSMSKGLFAGVSLEGSGIEFKPGLTQAYYGGKYSAKEVLEESKPAPTASAKTLCEELAKYSK